MSEIEKVDEIKLDDPRVEFFYPIEGGEWWGTKCRQCGSPLGAGKIGTPIFWYRCHCWLEVDAKQEEDD